MRQSLVLMYLRVVECGLRKGAWIVAVVVVVAGEEVNMVAEHDI